MKDFEPNGTDEGPNETGPLVPTTAAQLRLIAITAMTSTLAHDLTQPLSAAQNYLHGALRQLRNDEIAPHAVEMIERSTVLVARAVEIIRRVRSFVVEGIVNRGAESLSEMVGRVCRELVVEDKLDADFVVLIDPDADEVMVDRIQIELVLTNLIVNALEAMAGSGFRWIEVRSHRRGEEIAVRVRDSGPGLTKEIHDQLFVPFFTTKPGGFGLGLLICKAIVEANGGQLWAGKPTGSGAAFHLTLPVAGVSGSGEGEAATSTR